MTTEKIREILVPVDGSGTAEWAIPTASAIARKTDAALHLMLVHTPLVRVFPDITAAGYLDEWEERQHEREASYVEALEARLQGLGLNCRSETARGDAASRLADRAAATDLVIMTAHGWAGPERAWLGHVTDAVVHHVRRPVVIVRAPSSAAPEDSAAEEPGFRRVFVATDGSAAARAAEEYGELMARLFGGHLTLFRAFRAPSGPSSPYIPHAANLDRETEAAWEERARRYLEARGAEIEGVELSTRLDATYHPARAILEAAADSGADLVAVGTHRDSRLARAVLGSVADKVVRGARLSVLVAHADRP
jgi:nucleotide-binding universal stress UspA family protein